MAVEFDQIPPHISTSMNVKDRQIAIVSLVSLSHAIFVRSEVKSVKSVNFSNQQQPNEIDE